MKIKDEDPLNVIRIDRRNLFNDAFKKIMDISSCNLKNRLIIKYVDEEGLDCGGLLRYKIFHKKNKYIYQYFFFFFVNK